MKQLNLMPAEPLPGSCFVRQAARAIVIRGNEILLLYTARYDDYTLPGGGIDENENIESALARELLEETGAKSVTSIQPYGIYEEYQHWYKPDFDTVKIISHCFLVEICGDFTEPQMESYEQANGMRPVWLPIKEAIAHNKDALKNSDKKGQSLQRETIILETVAKEFKLN
ncbi:NUDIX hydrolase [Pseudoalteromonas luteoviolacea]|uniref:NUDIX hydrolase n=1 Tax=Pseudoalteromonas luteoviolacea TaxID=43657 RepID=UPI0011537E74|nr:NUDIX domain-containing protein [Pseudoalteromonas luteoviolacea]TQF69768.1 NUDIX domain-containing protein [Pseudoalteromonas luteoviolacea]